LASGRDGYAGKLTGVPGRKNELWRWQRVRPEAAPVSLEPIDFGAIEAWREDDHGAALRCFMNSAALAGFDQVAKQPALDARLFFEENFTAHRIPGEPGLLTSYFEPVLKGSRRRSALYPVPVYRRPADLEALPDSHPLRKANLTAGRFERGAFEPYFTRGEIEDGALAGSDLELLFVSDPIEAFIMHVQGSGRVELDDGSAVRLSFDGKNGHPYTSLSKLLIARGELTAANAHLDGLIAWLRSGPQALALLRENKSHIFFKELEASAAAPEGSMGVALTPGRSLAADPVYHSLGFPIWVAAPGLTFEGRPFRRLVIAQDTGSAIIGPQRGDIFAGSGAAAGGIAGHIRHACEFIVLLPKRELKG
jgi:membrane-bound lytic murein transglycosylase A